MNLLTYCNALEYCHGLTILFYKGKMDLVWFCLTLFIINIFWNPHIINVLIALSSLIIGPIILMLLQKLIVKLNFIVINKKIDNLFGLYDKFGGLQYSINEDLTQSEHALQCALLAAKECKTDDEMIVAGLFHDIGHLWGITIKSEKMGDLGILKHAEIGGEHLKKYGFSNRICELVSSHVLAKKYLVTIDENYYNNLSEASKETLKFQGGKMTDEELKKFNENPNKNAILLLRSFDEKSKIKDLQVPTFESYRCLIQKQLHENFKTSGLTFANNNLKALNKLTLFLMPLLFVLGLSNSR